jgi:type I restriction enzyme, S subunit
VKAGWKVKKLGEVIELISGQHIDSKDYNTSGKGVGYLTGPSDFGPLFPIVTKWTEAPKRFAEAGDVLLTVKGSGVGKINVLDIERVAISRQIMAVRAVGIVPQFLYLLLHSLQDHFQGLANGAAIPGISRPDVTDYEFPLPPLEEQHQIVAVLDEAFEGLARARAHAEANLRDARELLANTIDSLMASDGTATEVRLGDLCAFENGDRGKNYPGRKAFVPTGVPFINAGHLLNGPIDWANMNFIPLAHFNRLSNGKVRPGDLLFCLRGSLGKFGTVDSTEPGAIASSLVIVRPKDRLLPEYLAAYFESSRCAEMIKSYGNGAAQPNLSAKSLAAFAIALPDLEAQSKVVSAVAEIRQATDQLCRAYETKLEDIDALCQSLLQKAFAGELK